MVLPLLTFLVFSCNTAPGNNHPDTSGTKMHPTFSALPSKEKSYYASAIAPLYQSLLLKSGFNGSILLAKNGEIVFEDYHGYSNLKTKAPITENTPFHVASITKTFTATVVLKLMEEGMIALEDPIEKYLPGFPYRNISIQDLLTHRSGLPKYEHFMDGTKTLYKTVKNKKGKLVKRKYTVTEPLGFTGFATNQDLLNYMIKNRPNPEAMPGRRYMYCNTNYALLALVIEKITHMSYPEYLSTHVFKPLGMTHSFVFSILDTANYQPSYNYNNAPFKLDKLDCIYGDKNIYTTVRDLNLWDIALSKGNFISDETLEKAYRPYSNEHRGKKNYGLGWHLLINPPDPTIVYHNGWWHGNNAVFKRLIADSATVIILGNKFNRNIWAAGKISSVFTGHADTTLLEE